MEAQSNASEAALDQASGNALASCKRSTPRSPGSGAFAGLDEYEIGIHPAPFLDDVYLKELYDGRRPSLGRVFAFYSERDRKGGPALGAGVGGANRAR